MSIESSYKAEFNYNAKVKLLNENNIYKSSISVNPDTIIIQFYEYFVGNIARIKLTEKTLHYQKILKKMAILSPLLNCMTLNIFKLFKIVFTKKRLNLLIKKLKSIVITSEILKFTYMD